MKKNENEFWNSSLKKVYKQLDIYAEVNKIDDNNNNKSKNKNGIIETKSETLRLKSIE